MQIQRIQNNNYYNQNVQNNKNVVFGYKLPYDPDLIVKYAKKALQENGETGYQEYLTAVNQFVKHRFNAQPIVDKYLPEIKTYGAWASDAFAKVCNNLNIPQKVVGYESKTVTKKVPKSQSFFEKIFGCKQKFDEVSETVLTEVKDYDFKNIDVKPYVIENKDYFGHKLQMRIDSNLYSDPVIYEHVSSEDFPFRNAESINNIKNKIDKTIAKELNTRLGLIVKEGRKEERILSEKREQAKIDYKIEADLKRLLNN